MYNLLSIWSNIALKIEYVETSKAFAEKLNVDEGHMLYLVEGNFNDGHILYLNEEKFHTDFPNNTDYYIDGCTIHTLVYLQYEKEMLYGYGTQAHITRMQNDVLYSAIYGSIFKLFCEYQLTKNAPNLGTLLTLFHLSTVKQISKQHPELTTYRKYIEAIDDYFNFDSAIPFVKREYFDFMIPLVLSSIRTNIKNVVKVTELLTAWLRSLDEVNIQALAKTNEDKTTENDVHLTGSNEEELIDILRKDKIRSIKNKMDDAAQSTGQQAGVGTYTQKINNATQFFINTINKYAKQIAELEYIFRQNFTAMKILDSFEGDISLRKQQEAYIASKTAEDLKVFQYYLRKKTSVDIAIIRDISGSTYRFETEYAEAIIEILAAVESFEGIRTMVIDFNGAAEIKKSFSDSLQKANILPISGGGTSLLPAIQLLQEQKFTAKRRLLFLLSDGEINDRKHAESVLQAYCKINNIEIIRITFNVEDKYGYEHTTIINLHKFIANKIIEKGADI